MNTIRIILFLLILPFGLFAQSIGDKAIILKNSVDTGITNKNALNKVRAVTEGSLIKSVIDFVKETSDSAKSYTPNISLYLLKTDTATLSNRINSKLNKTDTTSLSNRINDKSTNSYVDSLIGSLNNSINLLLPDIQEFYNFAGSKRITVAKKVTYVIGYQLGSSTAYTSITAGNNVGDIIYYTIIGSCCQNAVLYYDNGDSAPFNAHFRYPATFASQAISQQKNGTSQWIWDGSYWNLLTHSENNQ